VSDRAFDFLRIPSVWLCFGFFFVYAMTISVVQTFASEAARQLHSVPLALIAICLTSYMLASATGMVMGGFLASDPSRCERVVASGFFVAASVALLLGFASLPALMVPVLFGVMGFAAGLSGPSRDLLIKRATPAHATGRVYGVVYSGLDIGQAVAPIFFGLLMDHQQYRSVFIGLALIQAVLILNALNISRVGKAAQPLPG
jgi:MFS family permease